MSSPISFKKFIHCCSNRYDPPTLLRVTTAMAPGRLPSTGARAGAENVFQVQTDFYNSGKPSNRNLICRYTMLQTGDFCPLAAQNAPLGPYAMVCRDARATGLRGQQVNAPHIMLSGAAHRRLRRNNHTKNVPPANPVTIPMGISSGAITVRATISAQSRKTAPNSAEAGSTRA